MTHVFQTLSFDFLNIYPDPASPIMEGIIHFHNQIMFVLILIGSLVLWLLYRALVLFREQWWSSESQQFAHCTNLEIGWTLLPAVILLCIGIPSFSLLYSLEEVIDPSISLKVVGHQWYWSYEFSDYASLEGGDSLNFDSYMIPEEDLSLGQLRLLEVDRRVVLPIKTHLRILVTAADVLHSWAIPALGVKIDACPGRLNQLALYIKRKGVFYGQCSEICGINHGFMPIVIEAVSLEDYKSWIVSKLAD